MSDSRQRNGLGFVIRRRCNVRNAVFAGILGGLGSGFYFWSSYNMFEYGWAQFKTAFREWLPESVVAGSPEVMYWKEQVLSAEQQRDYWKTRYITERPPALFQQPWRTIVVPSSHSYNAAQHSQLFNLTDTPELPPTVRVNQQAMVPRGASTPR